MCSISRHLAPLLFLFSLQLPLVKLKEVIHGLNVEVGREWDVCTGPAEEVGHHQKVHLIGREVIILIRESLYATKK